jgi:hypothetical protein
MHYADGLCGASGRFGGVIAAQPKSLQEFHFSEHVIIFALLAFHCLPIAAWSREGRRLG